MRTMPEKPEKWERDIDEHLKPFGVCFSDNPVREEDAHFAIKIDSILNGERLGYVNEWIIYRGYKATLMKMLAIALLCFNGVILFHSSPLSGAIFLACAYTVLTALIWSMGLQIIYYHHLVPRHKRDEAILKRLRETIRTKKIVDKYRYPDPPSSTTTTV